ncbi:MAG: sigma-70 family RNA polymerase sigma factor [Planctomycetaceae bacterium]
MSRYNNPAMKQLADQQMRYAPREVRLAQADQAEKFLSEIDLEKSYRYGEICERITDYRPERYPDLVLTGKEAAHDLRCLVEDLSDSADVSAESVSEPVLTVDEVSKRYNVSTKTVDRWRNRGLVSRRFRFGGRKRIGFLESSLQRFVGQHESEVNRGRRFSQLDEAEREEIVRRARRLARYGGCPSDISRRLAKKLRRSPETIRYTLKNYDKEHPESAVFPNATNVLTEEQKREIFAGYRRGVSVADLARRHCRTKTSVYRVISEVRADRLLRQPIDFMYNEEFEASDADKVILGPPPQTEKKSSRVKPPPGLPPYLASLYAIPLLTREEEGYYFRKMNYLKFKAAQLRESLDAARPKSSIMDAIEKLLDEASEVKNFLIRSNLRLVVSIAKRHIKPNSNFFEMVSDGNMSLIRAIEKFDYSKGNKFSTYASWAIMKNYARSIPAEHKLLDRFRTGKDELFQHSTDDRANQFQEELVNQRQRQLIMGILGQLDSREKEIILRRFGLNEGVEPQTLEQVGRHLGVTKERIRQLESRALRKLRKITQDEKMDVPGI